MQTRKCRQLWRWTHNKEGEEAWCIPSLQLHYFSFSRLPDVAIHMKATNAEIYYVTFHFNMCSVTYIKFCGDIFLWQPQATKYFSTKLFSTKLFPTNFLGNTLYIISKEIKVPHRDWYKWLMSFSHVKQVSEPG